MAAYTQASTSKKLGDIPLTDRVVSSVDESKLVHTTGDETISGAKTFSNNVTINGTLGGTAATKITAAINGAVATEKSERQAADNVLRDDIGKISSDHLKQLDIIARTTEAVARGVSGLVTVTTELEEADVDEAALRAKADADNMAVVSESVCSGATAVDSAIMELAEIEEGKVDAQTLAGNRYDFSLESDKWFAVIDIINALGGKVVNNPFKSIESVAFSHDSIYVGSVLSASTTPAIDSATYKWYRTTVPGMYSNPVEVGTGSTYTITDDDIECFISVTAKDARGVSRSAKIFVSTIPVVYLDTDGLEPIVSKEDDLKGHFFVQGSDSTTGKQYDGRLQVHGRGSSSWNFPVQKPYKIKLDESKNIFGFGEHAHWVLLSNFLDSTCWRNVHGSQLAQALGIEGMDMKQVSLVLNGRYVGVYTFGEHIRVGANRINIFDWEGYSKSLGHTKKDFSWLDSDTSVDVSGGYIFELSHENVDVSRFSTNSGVVVISNAPEYAVTSTRMMSFMRDFMNGFEASYRSYDGYNETNPISHYADVDSMAKYFLANEILANQDAGGKSRYCHLARAENAKLIFGPVWDFDRCGNSAVMAETYKNPNVWCMPNAWGGGGQNFFKDWLTHPFICDKIRSYYWSHARPWINAKVTSGLTTDFNYIASAAQAHYTARGTDSYQTYTLRNFANDCTAYRSYLSDHMTWMDEQFATLDSFVDSCQSDKAAFKYIRDTSITVSFEGVAADRETEVSSGTSVVGSVTSSNSSTEFLSVYVNGIWSTTISSNTGTFGVTDAEWNGASRLVVSFVARNSSGTVVGRTYYVLKRPADE